MKASLVIVRDAKGTLSVPFIGERCSDALEAMAKLPKGTEAYVVRNPVPFSRRSGTRSTLHLIVDPTPPAPTPAPAPAAEEPAKPAADPIEFKVGAAKKRSSK